MPQWGMGTSSAPATLASSPAITVGDLVTVGSVGLGGVVRYVGATHFAAGVWLGIELETACGKNDGSVKGERYFECKELHGLFVRPTVAQRVGRLRSDTEAEAKEAPQAAAAAPPRVEPPNGAKTVAPKSLREPKRPPPSPRRAGDDEGAAARKPDRQLTVQTGAVAKTDAASKPERAASTAPASADSDTTKDSSAPSSLQGGQGSTQASAVHRGSVRKVTFDTVGGPQPVTSTGGSSSSCATFQGQSASGGVAAAAGAGGGSVAGDPEADGGSSDGGQSWEEGKSPRSVGHSLHAWSDKSLRASSCFAGETHEKLIFELEGVRAAVASLVKCVQSAEDRAQVAQERATAAAQSAAAAATAAAQSAQAAMGAGSSGAGSSGDQTAGGAARELRERLEAQVLGGLEARVDQAIHGAIASATKELSEMSSAIRRVREAEAAPEAAPPRSILRSASNISWCSSVRRSVSFHIEDSVKMAIRSSDTSKHSTASALQDATKVAMRSSSESPKSSSVLGPQDATKMSLRRSSELPKPSAMLGLQESRRLAPLALQRGSAEPPSSAPASTDSTPAMAAEAAPAVVQSEVDDVGGLVKQDSLEPPLKRSPTEAAEIDDCFRRVCDAGWQMKEAKARARDLGSWIAATVALDDMVPQCSASVSGSSRERTRPSVDTAVGDGSFFRVATCAERLAQARDRAQTSLREKADASELLDSVRAIVAGARSNLRGIHASSGRIQAAIAEHGGGP